MSKTELNIRLELKDVRFPFLEGDKWDSGFELCLVSGALTAYTTLIEDGVPEHVWCNRAIRFPVCELTPRDDIIELAHVHKDYFQRILDSDYNERHIHGIWSLGEFSDEMTSLIHEWDSMSKGYERSGNIIEVKEQMAFEEVPNNLDDLRDLVSRMINYDGDFGHYTFEPTAEAIEHKILEHLRNSGAPISHPISNYMANKA